MAEVRFDLTTLAATDGFSIIGDAAGDSAGIDVSAAGDINGDGIEDFIVGASSGDDGGSNAGEAYVIFGRAGATRANIDLTTLAASDGFIIQGDAAGDNLGITVSSAGDINGDGIDDLIVAAAGGDNGGANAGEAYVIFGKAGATRANIDLTTFAPSDGFIIQGDLAADNLGTGVSAAGDVNGDGIDDLIVGAHLGGVPGNYAGTAYVIFGKTGATRANIDTSALAASDGFTLSGDAGYDRFGVSVSSAGDINGDGIDDLLIGARTGDNNATDAGEAYVIFGTTGATRANIDVTTLAATDGFIIAGAATNDNLGYNVSNAGDVNNDGIDDLIVGAPNTSATAVPGMVYVIYGKAGTTRTNINVASLTAADGFAISGAANGDLLGFAVSAGGDINGDGIDDIVVGAQFNDAGGANAGAAYIIFGTNNATRANISLATLDSVDGVVFQGDAAADRAGYALSSGDFNNDGFSDVLIGAPVNALGGASAGISYIIWGRAQFGNNVNGTAAGETLTGSAGDDLIRGFDGNDVLIGGAGADRMEGGTGNDIFVVADAGDTVVENATEGTDSVETTLAAYTLTANVENLSYTGGGSFTGTGNELANIIVGGGAADTLDGGDGNDTLGGEAGIDTLNGGNGNDRLNGGTGADTMNGGAGDDVLIVDNAGDVANGGDGIDTLQFTAIALTYTVAGDIEIVTNATGSANGVDITLNALANTYGGGSGADRVTAGDGADMLYGRAGNDTLIGEGGNDRLYGDTGGDSLLGGDGDDLIYAGADVDQLIGGAGNDTLYGDAGNDIIQGGVGVDLLYGGADADRFFFTPGETGTTLATADRIRDFSQGQGDQIDVQAFDANSIGGTANDAFSFIGSAAFTGIAGQLRAVVSGGQTLVTGDVNGDGVADFLIRVDGVHTLTASDFIL